MICVIDYGMGNLRSVSKAIEKVGGQVKISAEPMDIEKADKLVLPGVGAFGDGAEELRKRNLFEPLRQWLSGGRAFLGICLGMQLLFDESEESPGVKGLGFFPGKVQRFLSRTAKIPHIGWNKVSFSSTITTRFQGWPVKDYFYFVHSYYPVPQDKSIIQGACEYEKEEFAAFIVKDAIWASQFHPEKSQDAGLNLLKTFITL